MESCSLQTNNGHGHLLKHLGSDVIDEVSSVSNATGFPNTESAQQHTARIAGTDDVSEPSDNLELLRSEAALLAQQAARRARYRFAAIVALLVVSLTIILVSVSFSGASSTDQAARLYKNGLAYSTAGLSTQAAREFEKAIQIEPGFAAAHYQLGLSYIAMGDRKGVAEQHRILKSLAPDLAAQLHDHAYQ